MKISRRLNTWIKLPIVAMTMTGALREHDSCYVFRKDFVTQMLTIWQNIYAK